MTIFRLTSLLYKFKKEMKFFLIFIEANLFYDLNSRQMSQLICSLAFVGQVFDEHLTQLKLLVNVELLDATCA